MHPNSLKNLGKPFQPGISPNPGGKPVAARNALNASFLNAMVKDFDAHGTAAIVRTREEDPAAYLRVIASILPKELTIDDGKNALARLVDNLTDEQLATLNALADAASAGARIAKTKASGEPIGVH